MRKSFAEMPRREIVKNDPWWGVMTIYKLKQGIAAVLILSGFCLPSRVLAAPALVQDTISEVAPTASITGTFSVQPSTGNLLIAIAGNRDSLSIDSTTSGWQTAINESGNTPGQTIFYRVAEASEATTFSIWYSDNTRLGLQLYEYSGIDQDMPFDTTSSDAGESVSASSGTITTIVSDQLLIVGIVANKSVQCSTWTSSFVEQNDFVNSGPSDTASTYAGADRIPPSTGSYSTTATLSGGGSPSWRGQMVSFYPNGTLSVSVDNSTFSFGVQLADTWLTPDSSLIINSGQLGEDFTAQISQFTDGSNNWAISAAANGSNQIRGQWSTTAGTGPWTDIAGYDNEFVIATNTAVNDTVTLWFRIQTPVSTNSYNAHSSNLTVTATKN